MVIYIPVHKVTGRVDWEYITYMYESIPTHESAVLIDDWEYKPFVLTPQEID